MKESALQSTFCNFQDLVQMIIFSPFKCQGQKVEGFPSTQSQAPGPAAGAEGSPVLRTQGRPARPRVRGALAWPAQDLVPRGSDAPRAVPRPDANGRLGAGSFASTDFGPPRSQSPSKVRPRRPASMGSYLSRYLGTAKATQPARARKRRSPWSPWSPWTGPPAAPASRWAGTGAQSCPAAAAAAGSAGPGSAASRSPPPCAAGATTGSAGPRCPRPGGAFPAGRPSTPSRGWALTAMATVS